MRKSRWLPRRLKSAPSDLSAPRPSIGNDGERRSIKVIAQEGMPSCVCVYMYLCFMKWDMYYHSPSMIQINYVLVECATRCQNLHNLEATEAKYWRCSLSICYNWENEPSWILPTVYPFHFRTSTVHWEML